MIKYRVIKKDLQALKKLGEENRLLCAVDNEYMYFHKKDIKVCKEKKQAIKTPEFIEFATLYKTIKNNGLSSDSLILKYNKLVEQGLHNQIMDNLKQYKLYLEVKKKKEYCLMASTYINKSRFLDSWDIIEDTSRKFIDDLFRERSLNKAQIENALLEIKSWELRQNKEITSGVVNNIIDYILNNGK